MVIEGYSTMAVWFGGLLGSTGLAVSNSVLGLAGDDAAPWTGLIEYGFAAASIGLAAFIAREMWRYAQSQAEGRLMTVTSERDRLIKEMSDLRSEISRLRDQLARGQDFHGGGQ